MNALALRSVTVPNSASNNASDTARSLLEGSSSSETTSSPELLAAPTFSPGEGEPLRHILLGTPGGVRQTIHLLHTLRYVENALWSPLVPIPDNQLIITPRQGEVMSLLIRNLRA